MKLMPAPKQVKGLIVAVAVAAVIAAGAVVPSAKAWAPHDTNWQCRPANSSIYGNREFCERRIEFFADGYYWHTYMAEWRRCIVAESGVPSYGLTCYPYTHYEYYWWLDGSSWIPYY